MLVGVTFVLFCSKGKCSVIKLSTRSKTVVSNEIHTLNKSSLIEQNDLVSLAGLAKGHLIQFACNGVNTLRSGCLHGTVVTASVQRGGWLSLLTMFSSTKELDNEHGSIFRSSSTEAHFLKGSGQDIISHVLIALFATRLDSPMHGLTMQVSYIRALGTMQNIRRHLDTGAIVAKLVDGFLARVGLDLFVQ